MGATKFRAWHKTEKRMIDWFELRDYHSLGNVLDGGLDAYDCMQFASHKDKNGKEIYEGDLFYYKGDMYKVVFENGCFLCDTIGSSSNYSGCGVYEMAKYIAVIGNVYENPELLDK